MKRMVKNGDLIDVEPDGTITVAGKPVGGGGSENDRELTLILPYASTATPTSDRRYTTIDDENVWNKLENYYYEAIKFYYNDGNPLGVFNLINYYDPQGNFKKLYYTVVPKYRGSQYNEWYGKKTRFYYYYVLNFYKSSGVNKVDFSGSEVIADISFDKSKFDALYKLADKPTQDGTYVLKATVSGGAVTYTWVAQ